MTRPARYEEPVAGQLPEASLLTHTGKLPQLAAVSDSPEYEAPDMAQSDAEPVEYVDGSIADTEDIPETENEGFESEPEPASRTGRKQNTGEEMLASTDLVRVYLHSIGKTALLKAEEEVELARRIEVGVFAGAILKIHDARKTENPKTLADVKAHLRQEDIEAAKKEFPKNPAAREDRADKFVKWLDGHADRVAADPQYERDLRWFTRDGETARNHLTQANLRLVVSLAKRYTGKGLHFLDIIQEGNVGLDRAVRMFDKEKGFKFSTYATWWIRQAITRGLHDQSRTIRLPVHRAELHTKMNRIVRELDATGEDYTDDDIARKMGVKMGVITSLREDAEVRISLDTPLDASGSSHVYDAGTPFGDMLADPKSKNAEEEVMTSLVHDQLNAVLDTLGEREADVVRLRYGIKCDRPHTLEEIGAIYGLSRERIRQIERQTMQTLRHPSRKQMLSGYEGSSGN